MSKFILKIIVFILPLLIIFGSIEYFVRNAPNAFITKSEYFKDNINSINTLILGTSHSQNGINPEFFSNKTANLSYGSQDIATDVSLYSKFSTDLKSLKTIIFEYDYHRMDIENTESFYRLPWYYIFYDLKVKPMPYWKKLSLYYTNMEFFNAIIGTHITGKPQPVINKFGFVVKNYTNEFVKSNYNEDVIDKNANLRLKTRHKELSDEVFNRNKNYILDLIKLCQENNIRLVFVASPLYRTYLDAEDPSKKKRVDDFMSKLIAKYNVEYYDLSTNKEFLITDFSNDDLLNATGAKKYSLMLNALLK